MRSSPAKAPARRLRWLALASLVAATPKCLMCLLAYVGLGAALGLSGPELCGAPAAILPPGAMPIAVAATGLGCGWLIARLRRDRSPTRSPAPLPVR